MGPIILIVFIVGYNISVITQAISLVLLAPRRRLPPAVEEVKFIFKIPFLFAGLNHLLKHDRCFTTKNKLLFPLAEIAASAIEQTVYLSAIWLLVPLFGRESIPMIGLFGYLAVWFIHCEFTTPFLFNKFTHHCPDPENGPWKAS